MPVFSIVSDNTQGEHAHTCGHWGVMLSEVERYMEQFKLEMPRDSLRTPTSWLSRISRASMKRHPTENIPRALHMRTLGLHAYSIGQTESTDYAMYGIDVCLRWRRNGQSGYRSHHLVWICSRKRSQFEVVFASEALKVRLITWLAG
jgi:hypothetical protein